MRSRADVRFFFSTRDRQSGLPPRVLTDLLFPPFLEDKLSRQYHVPDGLLVRLVSSPEDAPLSLSRSSFHDPLPVCSRLSSFGLTAFKPFQIPRQRTIRY